ncbi:hypothetical protein [Fredinandcohnia quinoae]|uniref:LXG domain-containing protein n=1 Tax=Fredinandcohnia quinoae TaxID=2918902 RepID=A0AAW5DUC3_9BACI|nr:hypothetical protein [Fredinandcohnia sp. SECRCQ15]MCH1624225.1 hypothetical protein [Fredinandcohnia sp. SECRCQ15]
MEKVVLEQKVDEKLFEIQEKFLHSYANKSENITDEQWLTKELKEELLIAEEEAGKMSSEIFNVILMHQSNYSSMMNSLSEGISKEKWFSDKLTEAGKTLPLNNFGEYLSSIDEAILEANTEMFNTIITKQGTVNQNPNLDGFIAEQYKANTFNLDAVLKDRNVKGEVLKPKPGETYGKNSLDGQIKDFDLKNHLGETGKIARRYQEKFGETAEITKRYFEKGSYQGQRKGVPLDQVEDIPGSEGFWSYKDVKGKGLEKIEAKRLQNEVQKGNIDAVKADWNYYQVKDLSIQLGQKAAFSGVQAAAISAGFDVAVKMYQGKEIKSKEVIAIALNSGADVGVKAALTGAVKVASERGLIAVVPKGTPIGAITTMVYVGVENAKLLGKVASGELSLREGLQKMEETTVSTTFGLISSAIGAAEGALIGAAALAWIPVIGPGVGAFIGGIVGGTVSYLAGSKVGEAVYSAHKKIQNFAKETAKGIVNSGAKVVKSVYSGVKSAVSSISRGIKSIFK